jgi:hypothetical protein
MGGWRLRFANGGWIGLERHDGSEGMLIRVAPDDTGRFRVRELLLRDTGEPVTAERLRAVRLGAIESVANLPDESSAIRERLELPVVNPPGSTSFFDPHQEMRLRAQPKPQPARRKLAPPRGRGYPDDFYVRVAETYREALRQQDRPVKAIAESADVPRSTAGRWVKEARRRGLLGEAQPGKAGDFKRRDDAE